MLQVGGEWKAHRGGGEHAVGYNPVESGLFGSFVYGVDRVVVPRSSSVLDELETCNGRQGTPVELVPDVPGWLYNAHDSRLSLIAGVRTATSNIVKTSSPWRLSPTRSEIKKPIGPSRPSFS